jgi:hypothetical protein
MFYKKNIPLTDKKISWEGLRVTKLRVSMYTHVGKMVHNNKVMGRKPQNKTKM